jgi:uncharacterized membrane protein YedE/YeeE
MTALPKPLTSSRPPDVAASRPAAAVSALRRSWNPYAVGAALGVLSWAVFAVVDKPLGVSTSLSAAAGACAAPLVGGMDGVLANPYWAKHPPRWDYGMLFLVGTFAGALVSAALGRSFRAEVVPAVWAERFGPSKATRLVGAFVGGVLVLYGARLAGGCTSGHGISGSLQLAVSSWTFFLTMFAAGILTAAVMFRLGGRDRSGKEPRHV